MTDYEPEVLSEDFGDAPDQITRLRQRVEIAQRERDSLERIVIDQRNRIDQEHRKEALEQALRYNQIVSEDATYEYGNPSVKTVLASAEEYRKFLSGEATN